MKKILLLIILSIFAVDTLTAQPVVTPGYDPSAATKAAMRARGIAAPNGAGGYEIISGQPIAVHPWWQNEDDYDFNGGSNGTWTTTNQVKFEYDPFSSPAGLLKSTIISGANTYTTMSYIGNVGDLNYLQIDVVERFAGATVDFNSVTLFDGISTHSLGSFAGVSGSWLNWYITGVDFTNGFMVEGEMVLSWSNPQAKQEHNKIQVTAGYLLPPAPPQDYIGWWDFNECVGNIAYNNALPPTDYPGLIAGAERMQGWSFGGLEFDGNDWVDVGDIPEYNFGFGTPFTLAAWIKFDKSDYSSNHLGNIISKMRPGVEGWSIGAGRYGNKYPGTNEGGFRFELNHKYNNHALLLDVPGSNNGPNGWGDGQWHFVVATYSAEAYNNTSPANASADDLEIYIDGVLQTNVVRNDYADNKPLENDARLRIGNRYTGEPNRGFKGMIDEVFIFDYALDNQEQSALYSYLTSEPSFCFNEFEDLVLWFDPFFARDNGGDIASNNESVQTWDDITSIREDAQMSDDNRKPVLKDPGIGNKPAVQFTPDYGATAYGFSDIMVSPSNIEITTDNPDRWFLFPEPKTLMVVFSTGSMIDDPVNDPFPYYSDGRQCIFEAGGPLSGFNIYIHDGFIVFGMWNRFQQKFVRYDALGDPDFYPLDPNSIYLAHLEYSYDGYFRAVISEAGEASVTKSDWVEFAGLTMDPNTALPNIDGYFNGDNTAVGGASRTRYHDYSTGETYSDHFDGRIGEVMLFNNYFDTDVDINALYTFMNGQYGVTFPVPDAVPYPPFSPKQGDGWVAFETETADMAQAQLSEAYPNPFAAATSFSLNIPESQNVNIELFDNMGNKVLDIHEGSLGKGVYDFMVDGTNLANGMYIIRATGEGFVKSSKVILSR